MRLQRVLAEIDRQVDNGDGGAEILECPRCSRPGTGLEERCGQRAAQTKDQPELGVHRCGDPGQWPRLRRRRLGAGESAPASAGPRRAPGGWATWPFADLTGTPAL